MATKKAAKKTSKKTTRKACGSKASKCGGKKK